MDLALAIISRRKELPHVFQAFEKVKCFIKEYLLDGISLSFNGGKDCTVLLHLVRAAVAHLFPEFKDSPMSKFCVIYFKTEDEFPDIIKFMQETSQEYKCKIEEISGDFKAGMSQLLGRTRIRGVLMGQRRGDPAGGLIQVVSPSDPGWPKFMRLNPILDWSYAQVWDFLKTFDLKYCSLYDLGYTSLGSTRNTIPNPDLQKIEDGAVTYSPAYMLKDESKERAGRISKPKSTGPSAVASAAAASAGAATRTASAI